MNVEEFRSSADRVGRMRELLADPVLAQAITALHASAPAIDADPNADALASVRILSQMHGYRTALDTLLLLAVHPPKPPEIKSEFKEP